MLRPFPILCVPLILIWVAVPIYFSAYLRPSSHGRGAMVTILTVTNAFQGLPLCGSFTEVDVTKPKQTHLWGEFDHYLFFPIWPLACCLYLWLSGSKRSNGVSTFALNPLRTMTWHMIPAATVFVGSPCRLRHKGVIHGFYCSYWVLFYRVMLKDQSTTCYSEFPRTKWEGTRGALRYKIKNGLPQVKRLFAR